MGKTRGTKKRGTEASPLDALCWRSRELGISYGRLSATITEEEAENIYAAYLAVCRKKQEKKREWIPKASGYKR